MSSHAAARVVVAAVGHVLRRDDGVGPAVLTLARERLNPAEVLGPLASPLDLLGAWDGAALAVVVDALGTGGGPGAVRVVELGPDAAPPTATAPSRASSHGIGLVDVLRLSRALGTAPARVVLVGVVGGEFGDGAGLSAAVARAVGPAAEVVVDLVATAASGTIGPGRRDRRETHCR